MSVAYFAALVNGFYQMFQRRLLPTNIFIFVSQFSRWSLI